MKRILHNGYTSDIFNRLFKSLGYIHKIEGSCAIQQKDIEQEATKRV